MMTMKRNKKLTKKKRSRRLNTRKRIKIMMRVLPS